MSRFSPCRSLTLEGVCRDCACDCAMRSHSLMRVSGETIACQEAIDKSFSPMGVNLIKDPGFENYLVDFTPPFGDAIPTRAHDTPAKQPDVCPCDVQYMDTTSASDWICAGSGHSWLNWNGTYNSTKYWFVENLNPRSGTYHCRWDTNIQQGTTGPNITVHTVVPTWGTGTLYAFSGAAAAGSVVTFSVYEMVSANNNASSDVGFEFWDSSDSRGASFGSYSFSFSGYQFGMPTSYTKREYSAIVPSGVEPIYFIASYYPNGGQIGDIIDIDDASLVIT